MAEFQILLAVISMNAGYLSIIAEFKQGEDPGECCGTIMGTGEDTVLQYGKVLVWIGYSPLMV